MQDTSSSVCLQFQNVLHAVNLTKCLCVI